MRRRIVWLLCVCMACGSFGELYGQNPGGMIVPSDSVMKDKDTSGQRDLIGLFVQWTHWKSGKPRREDGRKFYFSLLPFGTSVPGGGAALITSTTAGFYMGPKKTTSLSSITFSPSTNFAGKFSIPFSSNIWSANNAWNFNGELRFQYFPQYTWGTGGFKPQSDRILIQYSYLRLYQNALKQIKPYLYAGIGYNMDYHIKIRPAIDSIQLGKYSNYDYGTARNSNSFSSGLTFNILYDTRNNALNPLPGWYWNASYRVNPKFLGSDDFWSSLYLDARKYIPFEKDKQNMLAIWTFFWTAFGQKTPYLDLPAIGEDFRGKSGRGIYTGHYMGQTLYYLEAEYRRDITADGLFGFVVFANANAVTEAHTDRFSYIHPAGGAGLRIKFNKKSGTNITIDYAGSKGYSGIYLGLGEAF